MTPQVTILFTDIAGFTSMSRQVDPSEVMAFLNQLYLRYDQLLDGYNVYKVTSFFLRSFILSRLTVEYIINNRNKRPLLLSTHTRFSMGCCSLLGDCVCLLLMTHTRSRHGEMFQYSTFYYSTIYYYTVITLVSLVGALESSLLSFSFSFSL